MRFLNTSRFTDRTPLRLLDLAYAVVLLPVLLVTKAPMLLFLLVGGLLLLFRKKPTGMTLTLTALFGLLMLFFSLYGAFNFSGLSRLKIFIELLIDILLIATVLQRLTRRINFYLLVSPILFMALSLFFFHSIPMLIYVVVEIFVLLWMILTHRMEGRLTETVRMAGILFLFSLPWVVVLFLFFPRISFEHASYGFRGDGTTRMGHGGTMYLDGKALLVPSGRIVMEVGFEGRIPDPNRLYFRGTTLYTQRKDHWEPLAPVRHQPYQPPPTRTPSLTRYKVTLYPTQKRWLYLLEMPRSAPEDARMDSDSVVTVTKPIEEPIHYAAVSRLEERIRQPLSPEVRRAALRYPAGDNPRTEHLTADIVRAYPDPQQRARAIVRLFREQNLTYTLRPEPLDLNRSVDSFLFKKRAGYCVHFASAFALSARMAGIPSRIVTGYKADTTDSIEHYLVVKEHDAHAWVELYLDNRWQRYETTAYAARVDTDTAAFLRQRQPGSTHNLLSRLNLYLMYLKYRVETWILYYNHFRQIQLLETARNDPTFVYRTVGIFAGIVLLILLLALRLRRPVCHDPLLCRIAPLLTSLKKQGYVRREDETLHAFFLRCRRDHPAAKPLETIDHLYERIRYGGDTSPESIARLEQAIRQAIREVR